ncbi:hypothetical protein UlMin_015597 [Ulmus minor]
MWQPRFLCYIEGGQAEGTQKARSGSFDKTPSKEIIWKTFPCGLFLGPEFTQTWGPGGVTFLNPKNNAHKNVHTCVYKITYFNNVLLQENTQSTQISTIFLSNVMISCYMDLYDYIVSLYQSGMNILATFLIQNSKLSIKFLSRLYPNHIIRDLKCEAHSFLTMLISSLL